MSTKDGTDDPNSDEAAMQRVEGARVVHVGDLLHLHRIHGSLLSERAATEAARMGHRYLKADPEKSAALVARVRAVLSARSTVGPCNCGDAECPGCYPS